MSAPNGLTVPELLHRRADTEPDRTAIAVDGGPSLTYAEWDVSSDAFAVGLDRRGIRRGDRVALAFDNRDWPSFAVAYCGTLKVGAVAVPLPPADTAPQREWSIRHSGAGLVVGSTASAAAARATATLQDLVDDWPRERYRPRCGPDDPAQIIYTSGTTGRPKGVVASHANLVHEPAQRPQQLALAHSEHLVHAFSLATNPGLAMLVQALYMRPTTVVLPQFDARRVCAVVQRYRAGSVFLVPAMWAAVADLAERVELDLACVRLAGSSTAVLQPSVAARLAAVLPNAAITNLYTSTEAWPAQTVMVVDPRRPASVGRTAQPGTIRIAGPQGDQPAGQTGDVWLRAPSGTRRSYHDDEDATRQVFQGDWVRTGDVGYLDGDGYLTLVDRASDVVNTGGHKVSTIAVENALYAHPDVREAAVFGVPHPTMGEVPAAAVVTSSYVSIAALREHLRATLTDYQVPLRYAFLTELPRNANGKVLKGQLREMLEPGAPEPSAAPSAARAPEADPAAEVLLSLWTRALRMDSLRVDDNVFDFGADSISTAQVATAAGDSLGTEVPVSLLFDHPTAREQADKIRAAPRDGGTPEPPVPTRQGLAAGPLGTMQEWFWRLAGDDLSGRLRTNVWHAVRLRGPLRVEALVQALRDTVGRHDALRTSFQRTGSGLEQTVSPAMDIDLAVTDIDGPDDVARLERATSLVERLVRSAFALDTPPLLRARLYRLAPADHVFALAIDHMVADALSVDVIAGEIATGYEAALRGLAPSIPPPAAQYLDYVRWEGAQVDRERTYWEGQLAGVPRYESGAAVDLFDAACFRFTFPGPLTQQLRAAARATSTTMFMTLLVVFGRLVRQVLDGEDILLATPMSGRTRAEFATTVGCLFRPMFIRLDLSGEPTFGEMVARARRGTLDAFGHQHYPFHTFGDVDPHAARFAFIAARPPVHFGGLDVSRFASHLRLVRDRPAAEGLEPMLPELFVEDQSGTLTATLIYNRHAFTEDSMHDLTARLVQEARAGLADIRREALG